MKKVLIIAYGWPPKGGVGVMRTLKFAKYLPRLGWLPTVVTTSDADPGFPYGREDINFGAEVNVLRTGYKKTLEYLPYRIRRNLVFPDLYRGWFDFAVRDILNLLKSEKFDLILSSSPPETGHLIASRVKDRTGLPWVADLRDLWSEDQFRPRTFLSRRIARHLERSVLKKADSVIIVTEGWAKLLSRSAGISAENIRVVTNGFDDEDFNIQADPPEKFTISYTGKLNGAHQDPEIFFQGLRAAIADGTVERDKIAVRFYVHGYNAADIKRLALRHDLAGVVEERGRLKYPEAVKTILSSSALLFVCWTGGGSGDFWHSAKIFDYIGSRRPIICLGGGDTAPARLIKKLRCGLVAGDAAEMAAAIKRYYGQYLRDRALPLAGADIPAMRSYTRFGKTKELAAIFGELLTGREGAVI